MRMESIFIQIPSYRDWELPKTVSDAINKASGQHKLSFGIHNCILFSGEVIKPESTFDWVNIKYEESIAPKNIGLQRARYIANEFYDGEDYYLQIDAHMRFVKDWDLKAVKMIDDYILDGIQKPLITMYPSSYSYADDNETEVLGNLKNITRILFTENPNQFKETLIPTQTAHKIPDGCVYTASTSGGFIFTLGSFANIKPNQKIAFWGEEPLIAARAFTHGFDLVVPTESVVYHLYESNQSYSKVRRNHVWKDFSNIWENMDSVSKVEYKSILIDKRISFDGLGSKRTLEEFGEFSGLDFKNKEVLQAKWI